MSENLYVLMFNKFLHRGWLVSSPLHGYTDWVGLLIIKHHSTLLRILVVVLKTVCKYLLILVVNLGHLGHLAQP